MITMSLNRASYMPIGNNKSPPHIILRILARINHLKSPAVPSFSKREKQNYNISRARNIISNMGKIYSSGYIISAFQRQPACNCYPSLF